MSRFLLGLTGGMASGKSTVARWLDEAGFLVVDADRVVAELYAPGGRGAPAVAELFGPSALRPDGAVDHAAVAKIVFADAAARRRLEAAIHPLVHQRFQEIASQAQGVVVYEATLLVESGGSRFFDLVVSIEADPSRRLQWAIERGMDAAAAKARLAAQGDGEVRRQGVHRVLHNDGSLDDLRRQIDDLIAELRQKTGLRQKTEPPATTAPAS